MPVKREKIDIERIRSSYPENLKDFDEWFEEPLPAKFAVRSVYGIGDNAHELLACGCVAGSPLTQQADTIKIASRAFAAYIIFATNPGKIIKTSFRGNEVILTGEPSSSMINPETWLLAYYFNVIVRDDKATSLLCKIPSDKLRNDGFSAPEYFYLTIDAIQAAWRSADGYSKKVIAALREANNEEIECADPDYRINIAAPFLPCLAYSCAGSDEFGDVLTYALECHRDYWDSSDNLRQSYDGFVALPLLAMACLAHDRKVPFDVESDYIPTPLVRGEFLEHLKKSN